MTASHNASGAGVTQPLLVLIHTLPILCAKASAGGEKLSAEQSVRELRQAIATIESAMALPGKWRQTHEMHGQEWDAGYNRARNVCADDLEAIFGPAPPATDAPEPEDERTRVECRECNECGHIGINDAHTTDGACSDCGWSGPDPVEDKCPGCGRENCMSAACPECSGKYRLIAEADLATPPAGGGVDISGLLFDLETIARYAEVTLPAVTISPRVGPSSTVLVPEAIDQAIVTIRRLASTHAAGGGNNTLLDELVSALSEAFPDDPANAARAHAAVAPLIYRLASTQTAGGGDAGDRDVLRALRALEQHEWVTPDGGASLAASDIAATIRRLASGGGARVGQDWQPIETAPKDGDRLLLCLSNGAIVIGRWTEEDAQQPCKPTYWQPLPAAPTPETPR